MELTAQDIMVRTFKTIHAEEPVSEAARLIFEGEVRDTGYKPFGIMVVDDVDRLVGMVSMYDILYHVRPPFMNYELESLSVWKGEVEPYIEQFHDLKISQIMSSPAITAAPDEHLIVVIDRMVKKRARRLPVVEDSEVKGIVYLSDVFFHLCKAWL